MNEKNSYIDFIKGIAIFLVVFAHCLQYGNGAEFLNDGLYWENTIMKVIYSFHMPLFIAISGYLFYFSCKRHGIITSVGRRIKLLLPICVTWALILWLAGSIFKHTYHIKAFFRLIFTDFWFLWAVMICVVIIALIESIKNYRLKILSYIITVSCIFITPDFYWLNAHKFMLPYFFVGYMCAKNDLYSKIQQYDRCIVTTSLCMWGGLLLFYDKSSYIYTTGITLIGKTDIYEQLAIDIFRYLIGFAGVVTVLYVVKILLNYLHGSQNKIKSYIVKGIDYSGENSIEFYILSTYLFVYVLPRLTQSFSLNYIVTFVETVIVMLICVACGILLKRMGVIGKLIIGK